jgi:hypothetical protein
MPHRLLRALSGSLLVAVAAACAGPPPPPPDTLLSPSAEQTKLRSMQTRSFDVQDRRLAIRAVMETLQDLGFIIERANEPMGLVTAARFAEPSFNDVVGVTVTVRPDGEGKVMVRANAIYNNRPIQDPKIYQNFFAALQRSMFLGGS